MELISKTLPGFYNGVSQQSPILRLDTQGTLQENAIGTLVDGLIKRPNAEFIGGVASNADTGAYVHVINRDATEHYVVVITENALAPIEVYTSDGVQCTVQYGHLDADFNYTADLAVRDYLDTTKAPNVSFRAVSVADHTYIINNDKVAAMLPDVVAGSLTGSVQKMSDLPVVKDGFQDWDPGTAYDINAKVAYNGYLWLSVAANTGNLPDLSAKWRREEKYGTIGEIYEVVGDGDGFDNFYAIFDGDSWNECPKPGVTYKINNATMPHRLVRTGVNEFTFADITYEDRAAGDELSSPSPSFIGKSVSSVAFYKNRLCLLAGDNVILSKSGMYYDFWPSTVVEVLDDDAIDVAIAGEQVSVIHAAIPFEKSLILFSDQQQFALSSGDYTLSPSSVTITPTTHYPTTPESSPVASGTNVYFVSPRERYVAVREYQVMADTLVNDAADITAHVPAYIPSGTIQLAACNSYDMLFLNTDAEPGTVYVYKYHWAGNQKPQSAWSKWTFDGDVLGMGVIGTTLYMLFKDVNGTFLTKIALENDGTDSLPIRIHLDKMTLVQGVYDAQLDRTSWSMPYEITDLTGFSVINSNSLAPIYGAEMLGTTTVLITGDHSAYPCYIGKNYIKRYRLSEWYMRDSKDNGITEGRLQIRTLTLSFQDSGYFRIEVTPFVRDTLTHTITEDNTGVLVGVSQVGQISLMSGEEKFIVMAKSKQTTIDIVNDTYLPSNIHSGSFEGTFVVRSRIV